MFFGFQFRLLSNRIRNLEDDAQGVFLDLHPRRVLCYEFQWVLWEFHSFLTSAIEFVVTECPRRSFNSDMNRFKEKSFLSHRNRFPKKNTSNKKAHNKWDRLHKWMFWENGTGITELGQLNNWKMLFIQAEDLSVWSVVGRNLNGLTVSCQRRHKWDVLIEVTKHSEVREVASRWMHNSLLYRSASYTL